MHVFAACAYILCLHSVLLLGVVGSGSTAVRKAASRALFMLGPEAREPTHVFAVFDT